MASVQRSHFLGGPPTIEKKSRAIYQLARVQERPAGRWAAGDVRCTAGGSRDFYLHALRAGLGLEQRDRLRGADCSDGPRVGHRNLQRGWLARTSAPAN